MFKITRKATTFPLLILTAFAIALAVGNIQQRMTWKLPYDGVEWYAGDNGIISAKSVDEQSPAARAGIQAKDILIKINGENIYDLPEKERLTWNFPEGAAVGYTVLRAGELKQFELRQAWRTVETGYYYYLSAVGWTTLFIGLFILLKRHERRFARHFFIISFCIFVFSVFSYTGKLNTLDWMIYWGDLAARLLFPTLLLHLALYFPGKTHHALSEKTLFPRLAYLPFFILLFVNICFKNVLIELDLFSGVINTSLLTTLDRINLIYFSVMICISFGILFVSSRKSANIITQKQMRWILWGSTAGFIPFCLLYVPLYLFGMDIPFIAKLSILGFVLVPLSFATSITKFRLMDVEIIFKKGTVYLFSFTLIVAISYCGLLVLSIFFPELKGQSLPAAILCSALIVLLLYFPIQKHLQKITDRLFYKESYYFRTTISRFTRDLAAENDIKNLLDMLMERITRTLGIQRVVVFLKTGNPGHYRPFTHMDDYLQYPIDISDRLMDGLGPVLEHKNVLFLEDMAETPERFPEIKDKLVNRGLSYLIPCRHKDKINAVIGLGRKDRNNNLLSSEDIDLLMAIIGPAAIAIENAALYTAISDQMAIYKRLKNYNENIIESINAGVLVIDPEEHIEVWNSALIRIYGKNPDEAEGKKLDQVLNPDLTASIRALLQRTGEKTNVLPEVTKVVTRNAGGKALIMNLSTARLTGRSGGKGRYVVIFNDITEQKELEDMLIQSEKMASIGLLAAGVAHEVNTPITGISSFAQILSSRFGENTREGEILNKIQGQAERAAEIVNNLLNFSRLQSHDLTEVDLNLLIEETLALFQPQIRSRGIRIMKKFPAALPQIKGDRGKLQQVFLNLFLNARDAMPSGGDLSVTTRRVNASVLARVCDTGVGIPEENINKIYDPFFTTKGVGTGTGLGLSISYGIIREHSGAISVKSSEDHGTCFEIKFPVT